MAGIVQKHAPRRNREPGTIPVIQSIRSNPHFLL
jgi:hypothetical protein